MNTSQSFEKIIMDILLTNGPLLGSELRLILQEQAGLTATYARKIIQRATEKEIIHSTKPVSFQRGQFLYYLANQDISDSLSTVLKDKRKGLYRVVQGLKHNKGAAVKDQVHKWAASITNPTFFPKNDPSEKIISELYDLSIIHSEGTYNGGEYLKASPQTGELGFYWYRREIINRMLLMEAVNWLERTNLLAWNKTQILDRALKRVDFNGHVWDAVGYTYLYGYYQTEYQNQEKIKVPSLVFIESLFHRHTHFEDIEGFIARIEMQSARIKNYLAGSRTLPILFYRSITKDAFDLAKSKGLLMFSAHDWMGNFASELIEFLARYPVRENHSIKQCMNFISLLEEQERNTPILLQELFIMKHSYAHIQKGWDTRRHILYRVEDMELFIDWLMFDPEGNPFLCFFIPNTVIEKNVKERIQNEVDKFEWIYSRLGIEERRIGWMVFNKSERILERKIRDTK